MTGTDLLGALSANVAKPPAQARTAQLASLCHAPEPKSVQRSVQPIEMQSTSRYHFDTIMCMAMTLRLTDDEQEALRQLAAAEGISMQEAARRAVRDYVARSDHRERVGDAAARIMEAHGEALDRLGQ